MCRSRHPLTLVALFALLALVCLTGSGRRHVPASKPQVQASYARLPLSFEVNQGQADGQVQFLSRGPGYSLFLTGTEAVLSLRRRKAVGSKHQSAANRQQEQTVATAQSAIPNPQSAIRAPNTLRMKLAGANPKAKGAGRGAAAGSE